MTYGIVVRTLRAYPMAALGLSRSWNGRIFHEPYSLPFRLMRVWLFIFKPVQGIPQTMPRRRKWRRYTAVTSRPAAAAQQVLSAGGRWIDTNLVSGCGNHGRIGYM